MLGEELPAEAFEVVHVEVQLGLERAPHGVGGEGGDRVPPRGGGEEERLVEAHHVTIPEVGRLIDLHAVCNAEGGDATVAVGDEYAVELGDEATLENVLQLDIVRDLGAEVRRALLIGRGVEVKAEGVERPEAGAADAATVVEAQHVVGTGSIGQVGRGEELHVVVAVASVAVVRVTLGAGVLHAQSALEPPTRIEGVGHVGIGGTNLLGVVEGVAMGRVEVLGAVEEGVETCLVVRCRARPLGAVG